ncbi:3-dehydroquinate synthase, partial [bacterium]|nr:3-dehydroquinate synthase [bacterium]
MATKNNIILTGMPGCGKTYLGEKLAQMLGFKFIDTDALIEERLNMSIVDIFQKQGEESFRQEENFIIREILQNEENQVIALGGGAFNPKNIATLKKNGVVFYINASVNLLYERVKNESKRPMFMNTDDVKAKLGKLLDEREKYYREANFSVNQEEFNTQELLEFIAEKFQNLRDSIDILSYPVFVNADDLQTMQKKVQEYVSGRCVVVIDKNVETLYGKEITLGEKFVLKNGEEQKNIKNYEKILEFLAKNKLDRNDTVVAIGGGVTGDIAGFAAATYMRGINLIHIPTTLLACVDSSIGGKTGINSKYGKNLLGAFYQPNAVFCNLNFLKTIDDKQFKTGMAEVLKYAFIEHSCKASRLFNLMEILENSAQSIHDTEVIKNIIKICIELKESVVLKDEKESGLRQILNLGHTYGHALEKDSNYKLTHGEAVAQGMIYAFNLALNNRLISKEYHSRSMELLKKYGLF